MPAYSLTRTRADGSPGVPGIRQIVTLMADRQPFATLLHTTADDWLLHLAHNTPDGPAYDYGKPDGRYPDESTALADAKHRHQCATGPYGPGKLPRGTPLPPVHLTRQNAAPGPDQAPGGTSHDTAKGRRHDAEKGRKEEAGKRASQETGRGPEQGKGRGSAFRPHSRPKKGDRLRRHLT